ncbi:MAG: hypothetical protein ABW072_12130 [Sedimenticola sp.]
MKYTIRSICYVVLVGCYTVLTACGGHHVLGPEKVTIYPLMEEHVKHIVPGVSSRAEVRKLFDPPIISDDTLRLDLYQVNHQDTLNIFTWGLLPVFSFPTWHETVDEIAYLLVVYNDDWTVKEFDTGYFVEGVRNKRPGVFDDAEAGGLHLSIGKAREFNPAYVYLYAPHTATSHIIDDPIPPKQCKLFIATAGVNVQVIIDNKKILDERGYESNDGFIALLTPIGISQIRVLPGIRPGWKLDYKGELSKRITCNGGEKFFVEVHSEIIARESLFKKNTLVGDIHVFDEPSEMFPWRRLILYHDGNWLGGYNPQ